MAGANKVMANSRINARWEVGEPASMIYIWTPSGWWLQSFGPPGVAFMQDCHWSGVCHEGGHAVLGLGNEAHSPPWGKYKSGSQPPQTATRSIMSRGPQDATFIKAYSPSCAERFRQRVAAFVGFATVPEPEITVTVAPITMALGA
jgi:hypothetical protein